MPEVREIKIEARGLHRAFAAPGVRGRRGRRAPRPVPFVALENFDLQVRRGEFLVVVGPSGCGKTTFLNVLAGLDRPDAGDLLLDGAPVTGPGLDRGVVFQQYALFPWRTALQNVAFGLEIKGMPRTARARVARRYLTLVGLDAFAHRFPHQLSGGMRQRVALARALAFDPDVLLMDEPFAALDTQTREVLQRQLLRIWQRTGKTVVFITHSIEEAVFLGQRVAVMTAGPGRVKEVVDIDLPPDRADDDEIRSSEAFTEYRRRLWRILREEVAKAQPDLEVDFDPDGDDDLSSVPARRWADVRRRALARRARQVAAPPVEAPSLAEPPVVEAPLDGPPSVAGAPAPLSSAFRKEDDDAPRVAAGRR